MAAVVSGIVKEGKVVPQAALPEGLHVQILLPDEMPADLQEELNAWALGSVEALALVEHLAEAEGGNEKR
jgi:hypothetical protein